MSPFETFFNKKETIGENQRAKDEGKEIPGHHSENLYDQNEDAAGEKTDLATGRVFVNDGDTTKAARDSFGMVEAGTEDALPDIPEDDDEAARWLKENGG